MNKDNPWLTSLPLTEASVAAQAEVVDSIISRLERDRAALIEIVRGFLTCGIVCEGARVDYVESYMDRLEEARALLARLEKE